MKNKLLLQNILFTLIAISPVLCMLYLWNDIPDMIPVRRQYHFGDDAVPLSPKSALWGNTPVLAAITLLAYYLLVYIRKIDPKRAAASPSNNFNKLARNITLLMTGINLVLLFDSIGRIHNAHGIMMPILGLVFVFMGNMMYNIKPNYFAGIRLPWTLHSDDNWKKTHRLAGVLWFAMGLLFTIVYLLAPNFWNDTNFLVFIMILVLVPVGYSFMLHRKEGAATDQ